MSYPGFISVHEALTLLQQRVVRGPVIELPLKECLGMVRSTDTRVPLDSPPFDQSAMDGYAFRFADAGPEGIYTLQGIQAAGDDVQTAVLQPAHCIRIFTGAAVPAGADTVIIQEHTKKEGHQVLFQSPALTQGQNIRRRGSQVTQGHMIPTTASIITPGELGFWAMLGCTCLQVFGKPRVSVLTTGSELVMPGNPLRGSQIYESNSLLLVAALAEAGIQVHQLAMVGDDVSDTLHAIQEHLASSDILLLTGGISVGDYDQVYKAMQQAGIEPVFYKVKQKPGKPLFVGRRDAQWIFALPGNPASVFTCFYHYVAPVIRYFMGLPFALPVKQMPLLHDWYKPGELTHFIKASTQEGCVQILEGQESYKLNAFIQANALLMLEAGKNEYAAGDLVSCFLLHEVWC